MRYILFNNARESLLKKWVNVAIFSSHRTPPFLQTSTCKNSRWNGTQPHWTNIPSEIKVFNLPVNGVSYLSGFKLHLPGEMRSCVRAWNDWEGGGFASLNCLWKPGGGRVGVLVRLLGLSVLKWASVSSSPWSRSLAWLPCCNSSLFSRVSLSYRLFLFFFFIPKHIIWKGSVFCLPSPLEVTQWAMMWRKRTGDGILTCAAAGLMFCNCAQEKVCQLTEREAAYALNPETDKTRALDNLKRSNQGSEQVLDRPLPRSYAVNEGRKAVNYCVPWNQTQ